MSCQNGFSKVFKREICEKTGLKWEAVFWQLPHATWMHFFGGFLAGALVVLAGLVCILVCVRVRLIITIKCYHKISKVCQNSLLCPEKRRPETPCVKGRKNILNILQWKLPSSNLFPSAHLIGSLALFVCWDRILL